MSLFSYVSGNNPGIAAVNAEPIYGYPIYEQQYPVQVQAEECFPVQQTSAQYVNNVIPSATVTCISADFHEAEIESLPIALNSDSENDLFDGIIEILAEDCEKDKYLNPSDLIDIFSPVALPVETALPEMYYSTTTAESEMIYPAAFSYTVPEAKRIDEKEDEGTKAIYNYNFEKGFECYYADEKGFECYYADCDTNTKTNDNDNSKYIDYVYNDYIYNDFPIDCVAAFESMDMSENIITVEGESQSQSPTEKAELFEIGNIDINYLKSLHDSDEKRLRRKEAINRWRTKKNKRVKAAEISVKHAVKSSVHSISEAAAAACNSLLNPRQKATAKRERENGKFKKAQVKWVSVTELFSSGFDEFK